MSANTRLPDVMSQEIVLSIATPVRTLNLAYFHSPITDSNEEPRVVIMQCEALVRQNEALWFVKYNIVLPHRPQIRSEQNLLQPHITL
jgi:hypothetical protein